MFVRRLEQFSPTASNVEELRATEEAVSWIRKIKELQLNGHLPKDKEKFLEWVDKEIENAKRNEG